MNRLRWRDDKQITIYPWDTTDRIMGTISTEEGVPLSYLRIRQDLHRVLEDAQWEKDEEARVDLMDISLEWQQPDMISTMKTLSQEERLLFLRYKTVQGEIDEQLWDTLFRHDVLDVPFQEWQERVLQWEERDSQAQQKALDLAGLYEELSTEDAREMVGWKSENHRKHYELEDLRSLEEIFAGLVLGSFWRLSVLHQQLFYWEDKEQDIIKMRRLKDPSLQELLPEISFLPGTTPAVHLYHDASSAPVIVQKHATEPMVYEVDFETSGERTDMLQKIQTAIGNDHVRAYTDVGMVGHFIVPRLYVDFCLLQDMFMNDPVVSHFFFVNELVLPTSDTVLNVCFQPHSKGFLEAETIRDHDFSIRNTHRQSGFQVVVSLATPLSQRKLSIFFLLVRLLLGRYMRLRDRLLQDYSEYIPDLETMLARPRDALVKNIKPTRPEYIAKYPRMFVRNLYSVICQKNLQPVLLKEEDTYDLPTGSYILFPPKPIAEIEPEYYYCPNKSYPYAGLKDIDLKGRDAFINLAPCCFNSPQDKENERKIAKLRTKDNAEEEEAARRFSKTNVISGKLLIKQPGQLGTIRPPSMERFFMAYDPMASYFRVGTEQSTSSFIHCLLTRREMLGFDDPLQNVVDVRRKIAEDPDCVNSCLQENPGLTVAEVRSDMADPLVYFDPRRFYRAIELFFGIRVVVFSKPPDPLDEDAALLRPFSMRTHYTNSLEKPFVVVFEHWGGKTNLLSKFSHPHCELVAFKRATEEKIFFDFSPQGVSSLLQNTVFPFDGNQPIYAFHQKDCWFYRYVIGQTTDPLGKVRWLHFKYYNLEFCAEIYPPLAIQDDIPVGDLPKALPVVSARKLLNFFRRFDHWERVYTPDPGQDTVYWVVSQDRVLWKNAQEHSKLMLVVACRLDTPQPSLVRERRGELLDYIRESTPADLMTPRVQSDVAPLGHDDRVAHTLSQLCVHAFSLFLRQNRIEMGAIDVDVVLDSFLQQRLLIDPRYRYPEKAPSDYESCMVHGRLILPSRPFWDKIAFYLRWLMFYSPHFLMDVEKTKPNRFQKISDFVAEDSVHYYCSLQELAPVLRHSVENTYPLSSCAIDELPALCRKNGGSSVLWYRTDSSPYSHPSIVMLYSTYAMTVAAIRIWHDEHRIVPVGMLPVLETPVGDNEPPVFDWEPSLRIWRPSQMPPVGPPVVFRAHVGADEYLLFFPS